MAPMTYVAAAINFPMQDATLLAVDRALGLDWAAYVHFVDARPALARRTQFGYTMIAWPLFAIPVFLAAKRRYQRIEEFTFAFALALAATTIISALVPAIGVYQQIGLDPGTLKNINPARLSRSIARPAADARRRVAPTRSARPRRHRDVSELPCGVRRAVAWALWVVKWMRPVALLANGAMLAATPLNGGHYFIDVFAGAAIAVLAIIAARRICQIIARRQGQSVYALPKPMLPAIVPAE